jgi:hypothetical protein
MGTHVAFGKMVQEWKLSLGDLMTYTYFFHRLSSFNYYRMLVVLTLIFSITFILLATIECQKWKRNLIHSEIENDVLHFQK